VIELHRCVGDGILRIGHRGAPALEPENTIRSFERAIALGVDFVEFDVLDLDDGTLVVAHSDNLLEVSHGVAEGEVRPLALDCLRGLAPELPTFDEALDFFAGAGGVGLHVDVKCRRRGRELAEALRRRGLVERAVASSSRAEMLRELAAAAPELRLALTYPDDRHGLAQRRLLAPFVVPGVAALGRALPRRLPRWLAATGAQVAMLHYAVVSPAALECCHLNGAAVWAWTVNTADLLERLVRVGVDGVISDDPRIFRATLTA
jgi:glycerophosphoryl diester phosphodiesterase